MKKILFAALASTRRCGRRSDWQEIVGYDKPTQVSLNG
jgi:hypothetical protein